MGYPPFLYRFLVKALSFYSPQRNGGNARMRRPLLAWRDTTPFGKETDLVFPSVRLEGKKPLSASIMVQKYLRPAAVKAGVIKEGQKVRFGFHNFRHSLATALVKLKVDAKTVQGMLRHEHFGTTMQLYAQSDMESMHDAQGKFLLSMQTILLVSWGMTFFSSDLFRSHTALSIQVDMSGYPPV
jgi:Phage integrase family